MRFTRAALVSCACLLTIAHPVQTQSKKFQYPDTRKVDVLDDYHGTKVADPYRWLEDLDSKEVAEWTAAQNALTFGYLEKLPIREHFKTRIKALWDYPKVSIPHKE